jgi:uroporphyrinogen-III synthase
MSRLRLLVTRAAEDASDWVAALRERGHEPLEFACLAIEPLPVPADLAARLAASDWIVFTSPRAVAAAPVGTLADGHARVAAVGPATAQRLRELGGRCDLVAVPATGAALAQSLIALWRARPSRTEPAWRISVLGAETPDERFDELCGAAGLDVHRIASYRTVAAAPRTPRVDLAALRLDAVLLASPSAAAGLAAQAELPREVALACIGPTTARAARRLDAGRVLEARMPTLDGLLECLNEIARP